MHKHGVMSAHLSTCALHVRDFHSSPGSPGTLIGPCEVNVCSNILSMQDVFANTEGDENDIYSPTVAEIAQAQKRYPKLKGLFKKDPVQIQDMSLKVIDETDIIVYKNKRLVIPDSMRHQVVQWYHNYLMHPGATQLEETLRAAMYWKKLAHDV